MVVCICNNISSTEISDLVKSGHDSLDKVRQQCGAGDCCGKCQFKIHSVVQEAKGEPNTSFLPSFATG